MAVGAAFMLPRAIDILREGTNNWTDLSEGGQTLKVALMKGTLDPSLDHATMLDIYTHEVSGPGYTAGGKVLTNKRWWDSNAPNSGKLSLLADPPAWPGLDVGTPAWAYLYVYGGLTYAYWHLLAFWELGVPTTGVTYRLRWDETYGVDNPQILEIRLKPWWP